MHLIGRLIIAVIAISAAACASTGGVARPRPFPGAALPPVADEPRAELPANANPGTSEPAPAHPRTGALANPLIQVALDLRGTPYRNGGSDPSGFDCSGFVQWVFNAVGLKLPREVRDQFGVGEKVDRDEVQPGDLIFFETVSKGASHVGLAIGGDQFVHAPSSTGVVRVEKLTISYWASRFVGARRLASEVASR